MQLEVQACEIDAHVIDAYEVDLASSDTFRGI